MNKEIFIIVPVFNEENTIFEVLTDLLNSYEQAEIIVVDDGSIDNTPELISKIENKNLTKLKNLHNSGKGSAMILGLNYLRDKKNGIVIFCDSDLEIPTTEIQKIINEYEKDVSKNAVFGSRFLNKKNLKIYGFKFVINLLLTFLSNIITSTELTDMETALKSFRVKLIKDLDLNSTGFDIEPEIVYKLSKNDIEIYEVSIDYIPRGKSDGKKMSFKGGVETLKALIKFYIK